MKEVDIKIRIPDEAYEKLEKYGYDWVKNSEEKAKEVYFTLVWCEENEDH